MVAGFSLEAGAKVMLFIELPNLFVKVFSFNFQRLLSGFYHQSFSLEAGAKVVVYLIPT